MTEEKVRTIRLYGALGAKFGRVHRAVVSNHIEAHRYLSAMCPGYVEELMNSADKGVGYSCFIGKQNITENMLDYPVGNDDIRIAPAVRGRKSGGLGSIIMGIVIIGAAFFTGGASLAASGIVFSGAAGMFAVGLGAMLLVTGVAQMNSPQKDGTSANDRPENGASYNFNGPVNTAAQGNPWPLGHGKMIIGGALASVSLYAEDQQ